MDKIKKILAALIVTILFTGTFSNALAGGFIFTDDRCRPDAEDPAICLAAIEPVTVEYLVGPGDIDVFIELNRKHLPKDVGPKTVLPAMTVYLSSIN